MNELYTEFINFFKKHNLYDEKIFNYLNDNSTIFNYKEEEKRPYIGYYFFTNKQGILTDIKLYVPYITDYRTLLINIHEYTHGLLLYKKLGTKFKLKEDSETIPMLYEKIYLLENPNEELELFLTHLNSLITDNSPKQYRLALAVQKPLLDYYQKNKPNINKLEQKAKKLSRRHLSK